MRSRPSDECQRDGAAPDAVASHLSAAAPLALDRHRLVPDRPGSRSAQPAVSLAANDAAHSRGVGWTRSTSSTPGASIDCGRHWSVRADTHPAQDRVGCAASRDTRPPRRRTRSSRCCGRSASTSRGSRVTPRSRSPTTGLLRPGRPGRRAPSHRHRGRQASSSTAPASGCASDCRRYDETGLARLGRAPVRLGAGDVSRPGPWRQGCRLSVLSSPRPPDRRHLQRALVALNRPGTGCAGDQRPLVCSGSSVSALRCPRCRPRAWRGPRCPRAEPAGTSSGTTTPRPARRRSRGRERSWPPGSRR